MGKDPAILWYFDNWAGGTITLSRHLKGCYMDILNAQFNSGHLSIEEIKTVLGSDFSAWNTLQKKFDRDASGLFFSKRMDDEIEKRKNFSAKEKNFSEKQKDRVNNRYPKYTTVDTAVLPQEGNGNGVGNGNSNGIIWPFSSEKFMEQWRIWKEFKQQQFNFKYRHIGEQGALKELSELSAGNENLAIKIIHQSIQKGWKGFFELKQNHGTKQEITTNGIVSEFKKRTGANPIGS